MSHRPTYLRAHCRAAITLVGVILAAPTTAASLDFDAADSGFLTSEGGASKFDGIVSGADFNYSVGREVITPGGGINFTEPPVPGLKRNYFVFDLTGLTGTVIGATLELGLVAPVGGTMVTGGYTSPDATETFELYGTSASPGELGMLGALDVLVIDDGKPGGTPFGAIPDDYLTASGFDPVSGPASGDEEFLDVDPGLSMLAMDLFGILTDEPSAPLLGSVTVSAADEGSTVGIGFTPAGIAYLAGAAGGGVVFGGKLASLAGTVPTPFEAEELFSFSDAAGATLSVETAVVPLPAAVWLFGSGVIGLLGVARTRNSMRPAA